ncbi:hypothetical protein GSB13_003858 [Salmonella enterica]|uniref:Uncharacterized protein n=1 Tax=Salmonella enterica TaxID=28901 RepID=A0A3F3IJZ6_SALER|nr:hypothetical protein [Salmonella enterica]EBP3920937.1 hypothetical protein [Salmonella enterica subsp. enterica]ECB7367778.1 hypothetical protein [Salmonella enterica subsp. enterica serovar Fluntern]ECD3473998.1 hypothetical protein [Salmonella enterica subsp. enterica serovar Oranienburg]ECF4004551.1 hypothetical protein [Salmonella enterica subsp. enterica serovar Durban]ECO0702161.1 hypothetical protein [Salmonella enterica subsp. enterica serovar Rubislaw]EDE3996367.1 hypothetical pr
MDHLERLGYTQRYFLSHPAFGEKEVTQEEFINAERAAGFYPKSGSGVATGGFGSGDIRGRVETTRIVENGDA